MRVHPMIGTSACILGANVRFNGSNLGHPWIDFLREAGAQFVPVCPEMAMGLGVPRQPLRLVRGEGEVVLEQSGADLTDLARATSQSLLEGLPELDGFILAAKSPTCGPDRVKVYSGTVPFNDGVGVFAAMLKQARPNLLVIDSGRLHNPELREHFAKGVFTLARFRYVESSRAALQDFHRRHKFSLMAHHPAAMRRLGQIAADSRQSVAESLTAYHHELVATLRRHPTRGNIVNALVHMYGFVKGSLAPAQKALFSDAVSRFQMGQIPAAVPLHCLQMASAARLNEYLQQQIAWQPIEGKVLHHVL